MARADENEPREAYRTWAREHPLEAELGQARMALEYVRAMRETAAARGDVDAGVFAVMVMAETCAGDRVDRLVERQRDAEYRAAWLARVEAEADDA